VSDCPFCLISHGEAHAEILYSDESVIALLSAAPIRPGHTLVISRDHIPSFYELDEDVAWSLWTAVHRIARQIAEHLRPEHVGVVAAGWDVPHTHIHVLPMLDYHDITSKRVLEGQVVVAAPEELARQAAVLRGEK
jgi:histidine triad (HIT) family protein